MSVEITNPVEELIRKQPPPAARNFPRSVPKDPEEMFHSLFNTDSVQQLMARAELVETMNFYLRKESGNPDPQASLKVFRSDLRGGVWQAMTVAGLGVLLQHPTAKGCSLIDQESLILDYARNQIYPGVQISKHPLPGFSNLARFTTPDAYGVSDGKVNVFVESTLATSTHRRQAKLNLETGETSHGNYYLDKLARLTSLREKPALDDDLKFVFAVTRDAVLPPPAELMDLRLNVEDQIQIDKISPAEFSEVCRSRRRHDGSMVDAICVRLPLDKKDFDDLLDNRFEVKRLMNLARSRTFPSHQSHRFHSSNRNSTSRPQPSRKYR